MSAATEVFAPVNLDQLRVNIPSARSRRWRGFKYAAAEPSSRRTPRWR